MNELTETRRRMLLNIQQGKEIYDGFEGSSYGGAIRSVHLWRDFWKVASWDPKFECLKLTDAGARALRESKLYSALGDEICHPYEDG